MQSRRHRIGQALRRLAAADLPPFFGPVSSVFSLKSNIGSGLVFGGQVMGMGEVARPAGSALPGVPPGRPDGDRGDSQDEFRRPHDGDLRLVPPPALDKHLRR